MSLLSHGGDVDLAMGGGGAANKAMGLVARLFGDNRLCGIQLPRQLVAAVEIALLPMVAFAFSVVWQAAHCGLVWLLAPTKFTFDDAASIRQWYTVLITLFFQFVQCVVGAASLAKMLKRLRSASLLDVFAEYMLLITTFFGISFTLYLCFDESFLTAYESHEAISNNVTISELTSVPEQLVLFFYYSTSTQTFTGFGDVSPLSLTAEAVASLQMCSGIIFSVFIISMTLSRFALTAEAAAQEGDSDGEEETEDDDDGRGRGGGSGGAGGGGGGGGSPARQNLPGLKRRRSLLHCCTRIRLLRRVRRLIRGMLLVVIVTLEGINLLVLYFVTREEDGSNCSLSKSRTTSVVIALIASLLLQLAVVVMIISVSLKFVRNTSQVTIYFIIQSYASTLIAFGALYLTVSLLQCGSFSFLKKPDLNFAIVAVRFFYFSLVTMTTTGYGMVYPRWWVAQLLVTVHMLVSLLYSVVIFGLGLSKYFKIGEDDNAGGGQGGGSRRLSLELSSQQISQALVARAIRGESIDEDEVYVRM